MESNHALTQDGRTFNGLFSAYNQQIGNSLKQLNEQRHDVHGREKEIDQLYSIMERPVTPVAILLGDAGVGKTAIVEQFAKELNSGHYDTRLKYKYVLLSLRIGPLKSIGNDRLMAEFSKILDNLAILERYAQLSVKDNNIRFVLFIDELHMVISMFGTGTKIGGDLLKDVLARAPIRVITATTRREYDSNIVVDAPFSDRFNPVEINELHPEIVKDIAKKWWLKWAPDCPMPSDDIIDETIEANALYRQDKSEPRKTLHLMEDYVSHYRRKGEPVTREIVHQIFKNKYSVSLGFKIDSKKVYDEVARRIKGQPDALYTIRRLLRATMHPRKRYKHRPMMTALFTGPTGVGKTETVKAIASVIYPEQHIDTILKKIDMPMFKTLESAQQLRKIIGEFARHTSNGIILLDEIEKASPDVRDDLLAVLDEGEITFTVTNMEGRPETNTISLRNTIIIATTNEGHQVFETDSKYVGSGTSSKRENVSEYQLKAEYDQLNKAIRSYLERARFRPEFLNRFTQIVPYRGLSNDTFVELAQKEIDIMIKELYEDSGIEIVINEPRHWEVYDHFATDLAVYIARIKAKSFNSNSGGARVISGYVDTFIYYEILEAMEEFPDKKKFKVEVTEDTRLYVQSNASTDGGVRVYAID